MSLFKKFILIYLLASLLIAGFGWIQEFVFNKPFWLYLTIYSVMFGLILGCIVWIILTLIERSERD